MASPKVLVFQHVPYEPLGTLDPLLKLAGVRIRYVNFGREPLAMPALDAYDGVIVLGGPMNVDDDKSYPNLPVEVELLAEAVEQGKPCLGICLGAQLLARSQGGSVQADSGSELGWYEVSPNAAAKDDVLLGAFADTEMIFHWHLDEIVLPAHALHLASSAACRNQAFRFGDTAWGLQFHMEVNTPLVERWLCQQQNQQALSQMGGAETATEIRAANSRHMASLQALSNRAFGRWIDLFELPKRKRSLPSR
ncbi:MAG: type 1 glutamine amidotransferase [Pseudomonadota bacterium]